MQLKWFTTVSITNLELLSYITDSVNALENNLDQAE